MAATDTHAAIKELLEAVFSLGSVPRLYNEDQLPLRVSKSRERESLQADSQLRVPDVRSEQLVAEAGYSSGTQRKGNVRRWKPLPSSAVKTVTENTSLCAIVICKL
jgi:hypothetical protein